MLCVGGVAGVIGVFDVEGVASVVLIQQVWVPGGLLGRGVRL